jgi:large conductance mechanosensitive channel
VSDILKEFRAFILRGNVLDLAVAVILGTAFGAVVKSFADDILMALIAAIFGKPDFSEVILDIGDGQIKIGAFINTVITFLIVAGALFLIIKTFNELQARRARGLEPVEE